MDPGGPRWKAAAKLTLIALIAGALLAGLPFLIQRVTLEPDELLWSSLIGLGLGAGLFYFGFKSYRERQLVRDTPTSKIRSLAVGTSEVKGEATPVAKPLVSPLTHTPACIYEFKVQEKQPKKKTRTDPDTGRTRTRTKWEWKTVLTMREHVPFYVDDGTGRVPVKPDGATLVMEVEKKAKAGKGASPPGSLAAWFEDHADAQGDELLAGPLGDAMRIAEQSAPDEVDLDEVLPEDEVSPEEARMIASLYEQEPRERASPPDPGDEGSLLGSVKDAITSSVNALGAGMDMGRKRKYLTQSTPYKRRFEERVLAAGEETYVFGAARRAPGADSVENVRNLYLQEDPHTGYFLVSDRSERGLLDRKLVRSVSGLAAAVVLLSYGAMGLFRFAGLI